MVPNRKIVEAEALARPEDRVETPAGAVTISFLRAGLVVAAAGYSTGWMTIDDVPYYAVARFEQRDGDWHLTEKDRRVGDVVNGKAGGTVAPPDVEARAYALLAQAVRAWSEHRPTSAARVRLAEASMQLIRGEDEIANLERRLAEARGELPTLRSARQDALAALEEAESLEASTAAGTPKLG